MKKLISLLLTLTMILALTACAQKKPVNHRMKVIWITLKVKANLSLATQLCSYELYRWKRRFYGFDTELAILTCEKLGVEPEFVEINWDTKEVELNAKSIDCIWNGLTIDDDRKAKMEITQPYVKNAQVVLVKEGTEYNGTESW